MSANILLVGSTDRQLEEALRACGMKTPSLAGSELSVLAQPTAKQPDVLVIDIRDQSHLPAALPVLKRQHPTTGVIIIASRLEPALLLEAMRSGVNEFVTDPVTPNELEAAIARVLAQRPSSASGETFAFIGAKGGVGATTVAVNVATAIARTSGLPTLLIDLHITSGDTAVFLGAEPKFSVVDALENTHRLDEAFFRSVIVKTKSGLDLLASSDRMLVAPLDVKRVRTLLEFASRHYRYVILDVPRSDSAVLDGIEGVARIVIVANQELATVRSASRMASALRQRYGKDKLSLVLTRTDAQAEIGQDDIERAVGVPVRHAFPSDYRRVLQAVNKGRPITLDNHNDLSGSFVKFARLLANIDKPAPQKAKSSPALFGGLFGGRKNTTQEKR